MGSIAVGDSDFFLSFTSFIFFSCLKRTVFFSVSKMRMLTLGSLRLTERFSFDLETSYARTKPKQQTSKKWQFNWFSEQTQARGVWLTFLQLVKIAKKNFSSIWSNKIWADIKMPDWRVNASEGIYKFGDAYPMKKILTRFRAQHFSQRSASTYPRLARHIQWPSGNEIKLSNSLFGTCGLKRSHKQLLPLLFREKNLFKSRRFIEWQHSAIVIPSHAHCAHFNLLPENFLELWRHWYSTVRLDKWTMLCSLAGNELGPFWSF